ncbi:helix-turn-helix domain-containing protein [Shimia sp. MMG029]|uniref:helix-turn-helix domain-containing protein n=1 Tax=Shimia sp. MMG029 TaxID=3021978 RepID=UPI0022FE2F6A|nr:helix-turn-helix domain-containing protein [Shimia sp. MMG029]MDA5555138.1 helix-turn-helix domain-containing protein [Shimia sp. MMG029]
MQDFSTHETKNRLFIFDDHVVHMSNGQGATVKAETFVGLIEQSGSLKSLKKAFGVRNTTLLKALEHFGFDFDALLKSEFECNRSDTEIAKRHGVDAKWVDKQRRRLNYLSHLGRPSPRTSDWELAIAFKAANGNHTAAAKILGIHRSTFTKRYREMRDRLRGHT